MKEVKLEEMKREYEDIPVPEELEFRVRASIERAKLERKKGNAIMTTVKRIVISLGATAAAFMVGVTGLANSSATIAHAMEQIPVLGAITKVVTFRNYEDDRGNTSAHIEVPQIEGGKGFPTSTTPSRPIPTPSSPSMKRTPPPRATSGTTT